MVHSVCPWGQVIGFDVRLKNVRQAYCVHIYIHIYRSSICSYFAQFCRVLRLPERVRYQRKTWQETATPNAAFRRCLLTSVADAITSSAPTAAANANGSRRSGSRSKKSAPEVFVFFSAGGTGPESKRYSMNYGNWCLNKLATKIIKGLTATVYFRHIRQTLSYVTHVCIR